MPARRPSRFSERRSRVAGREAAVADSYRSRLLGLALLDPGDVPPALLIPNCHKIHTFGMRFALDLYWLDAAGEVLAVELAVPRRRLTSCRGAESVLEVPAGG